MPDQVKKYRLDLDLILPDDADACDACVGRLVEALQSQRGIAEAHVEQRDGGQAKLCIHYDPALVELSQLQQVVERAGGELLRRVEHLAFPVAGLRHERQARLAEAAIAAMPGVLRAALAFGARRAVVEFDPSRTSRAALLAAISEAGLSLGAPAAKAPAREGHGHGHGEPTSSGGSHADHEHGGPFGEHTELVFSLACGALTGLGWAISKSNAPVFAATIVFVLAYGLGAWFTLQEVAVALRAKRFEIDFLMLLAALGAALLGNWFEGALLLSLFTFGHSLEGFAMNRARRAVEALSKLVPEVALRIGAGGATQEVLVADLSLEDRVLVKPNTRIPADGVVAEGAGSVNQAPVTGESVPVDKRAALDLPSALAHPDRLAAEHRVFAGTINGSSALTVAVTKLAQDSTLARVVKLVSEAETKKSPTQQFTERFERAFVPVIIAVVLLLPLACLIIDEPFASSIYRALAVLVAASPCALAIATPSAVLAGVARAARSGVLIKGGAHLEALGLVRSVAFDKTGTLTEGRPTLTDIIPVPGTTEDELLLVSLAVEQQSDHPLARAVVDGAQTRLAASSPLRAATEVSAIVGFGVQAKVAGEQVRIGKPGLFDADWVLPSAVETAVERLQKSGRTVMIVQRGEAFLGVLGVMDAARAGAGGVVAALHALGIRTTVMLTGDNQAVADAVASEVGIREARGDLLPEHKVRAIEELASEGGVAMVGDGVNDAPAMARSSVGIAMGAGGSDVALETADVALMADDLSALPFAVALSRAARRIIRQNLWASLGMVALLIPSTIFGVTSMGWAVTLHEGSTLLVVANALRLLAFRGPESSRAV